MERIDGKLSVLVLIYLDKDYLKTIVGVFSSKHELNYFLSKRPPRSIGLNTYTIDEFTLDEPYKIN